MANDLPEQLICDAEENPKGEIILTSAQNFNNVEQSAYVDPHATVTG